MSDPNYDRGDQDFTSSASFWAAMAVLALFLFGAFLYFAPGTTTAMNPGGSTNPSTTGSGTPSR